jgi:Fe2+ or Zn2+ uptake regulation protein
MAKIESRDELMNILKSAKNPLTTRDIMQKIKDKCPDVSINTLVALMERGVIAGEWAAGKGYVWMLSASI